MSASDRNGKLGKGRWRVPVAVVAPLLPLLFASAVQADVTVYEKAPSVEELQQKMLGGGGADQKKFKTRAIVFGESAPAEAAPAQAATPQAAVRPQSQAPAYAPTPQSQAYAPAPQAAAYAPSAAAVPQQTMQVSDNAIAFPIQFRVNSSQILPESVPFLQSIAGLMHKEAGVRLLIEGHTDISGNYQSNLALSRERASSVMNYLINRFGIEPTRFVPVGKGPTEILPGLDPADPKNRRVQFRIIG
jgi:outer membrane protein OmpA-like peptidoglycan-associated protein